MSQDLATFLLLASAFYGFVHMAVCLFLYARRQWRFRALQQKMARIPESVRAGSEFFTVKSLPKFLVGIYQLEGGTREYLGSGYRDGDWIVTPRHVLANVTGALYMKHGDIFYPATLAITPQHLEGFEPSPFVKVMPGDLILVRVSAFGQVPGLKSASVGPVSGKVSAQALCATEQQNSSIGYVINMRGNEKTEPVWGVLEYGGSTRVGFSGGVYVIGERVVGLHVGGGAVNYGYSASWIHAQLNRQESSELNALRNALKSARKRDVTWAETGDPEEVEVRVGGRYYRVTRSDHAKLREEALLDDEDDYEFSFDRADPGDEGRQGRRARRSHRGRGWKSYDVTGTNEEQFFGEGGASAMREAAKTKHYVEVGTQTLLVAPIIRSDCVLVDDGMQTMSLNVSTISCQTDPIVEQEDDAVSVLSVTSDDMSQLSSVSSKNGPMPGPSVSPALATGPSTHVQPTSIIALPGLVPESPIANRDQSTNVTTTSQTLPQTINGLKGEIEHLLHRLGSMLSSENNRSELSYAQVTKKLIPSQTASNNNTPTPIGVPPYPAKLDGKTGLKPVSSTATSLLPPASATSRDGQPSEMSWAGMASHVAMTVTWLRSADSSSKEYNRLREQFLTSLGLTPQQQSLCLRQAKKKIHSAKRRVKSASRALKT